MKCEIHASMQYCDKLYMIENLVHTWCCFSIHTYNKPTTRYSLSPLPPLTCFRNVPKGGERERKGSFPRKMCQLIFDVI